MTVTLVSQRQALWSLCVVFITTAGAENAPCPKGGNIDLTSLRCYWLSEATSSWSGAQDACRHKWGGDLASADSVHLQTFIHSSFPVRTSLWVWMKQSGGERSDPDVNSQAACTQMSLGTPGQWRTVQCVERCRFFCERQVTESLPSIESYLVGLVLMTGVYAQEWIHPQLTVPVIGQHTVEMQLFPGLWFSHAGQLASVELVVQPSRVPSVARIQILRPYCKPDQHLVPPGCSSLLNPFSCCLAVPLCNTTGGCSMGQYWCHLLETCLPTTSPCSPYVEAAVSRGFAFPPRYHEAPPLFHLVADLPLRINSGSEAKKISVPLPEKTIMVYPDDIVAVQHTRNPGGFLHCLKNKASLSSTWRQSYLSLRSATWGGWWEGGLTSLHQGGQWVDGVVCDLRMLYVDALHGGTEHEDIFGFIHTEMTTMGALTTPPTPSLRSNYGLTVIHPQVDDNNQIHVQVNVPTIIIVKVLSGEKARCWWSAPVVQSKPPFLPSCPEKIAPSIPECKRQSGDAWFSSATVVLPSAGFQTMNITVMDAGGSQSITVKICGYEAITGLSVEPHGKLRMLVNVAQSFTSKVESGSAVKFSWMIDNMENFAYEGESYSVVFKKPANYEIRAIASNPVSAQSQLIFVTVDEMIPLAEPEILFVREAVAVDTPHLYTIRVKVDISLPVTFRWDFGDGSRNVVHTQAAPCQTLRELLERGEKQVFLHHSVNHTYSIPDDYALNVQVSNQYDSTEKSIKISVRPHLNNLFLSSSSMKPAVSQIVLFEASTEPSSDNVAYRWDFGDGSKSVQSTHQKVSHPFAYAGIFNITLSANNTIAELTTWLLIEVIEEISGLSVSCNGPSELSSATNFQAEIASGTSVTWDFDFGDGSLKRNLTDGCISHTYMSPGKYTVNVTVSNYLSRAQQSLLVDVFSLAVSGVLPTECVLSTRKTQLTALVNGDESKLVFRWLFGDGSPMSVVTGQSTAMHTFASEGIFHVHLTVHSPLTSVSYNATICLEASISDMVVQSPQNIVALGQEVCFKVLFASEWTTVGQFKWSCSASVQSAVTEKAQMCFVFKVEGVEEVSVIASNKVSQKTAKASIIIQKPVSKFSIVHGGESDTVTINTLAYFWVADCVGSNVSLLWDFGDDSPQEQTHNVSHVFTSAGLFTVTATAFNAVSQNSATQKINVLIPVSDLTLHTEQPFAAVGEETLITAVSSSVSSTNYFWTVNGLATAQQGTQFRFSFPRPGEHQVRVTAQNLVSKREAMISIAVLERIQGLRIDCQNLTDMKYVPTQEELLFIASVTTGTRVKYQWLTTESAINPNISNDGEVFRLIVKSPGRISVQLLAANKLGETTSTISVEAVERLTGVHMTAQSDIVAVGKHINISVTVVTGSDLQYLWYVDTDHSPHQTHEPFLLHTFTSLGNCFINVSVKNVLSQTNDTKQFVVQEEVQQVDFRVDLKKKPFYVNSSAPISFHGYTQKGSNLLWDWKVLGVNLFSTTEQSFIHTFLQEGIYRVSLNVSNRISWRAVSHNVTVQDAIEGLTLKISTYILCTGDPVTFAPTIYKGSLVRFVLIFEKKDWTYSQDVIEGQFATASLSAGTHQVKVKAWNQVSSAEVSDCIEVVESIKDLQLVSNYHPALEALKEQYFKADVQSGFPVNFTWLFHLAGFDIIRRIGQEVFFTPSGSGSLSISVRASNSACSMMINESITVEQPVTNVKLVCHSDRIFVGHAVSFYGKTKEGSHLRYFWDFGDSTEAQQTNLSAVSHTYHIAGKYNVALIVSNGISHISSQLLVEVEEMECSRPHVSLIQGQSTILRSRPNFFEANVNINCSVYKTTYQWDISKASDCNLTGKTEVVHGATSPLLLLPKHSLSVGQYCLVLRVSLQGTPLLHQKTTQVTVIHSPLVAIIKGGSHRLWSSNRDLLLDGSDSHDPDVEPGMEDFLQYHWTCMTMNSTKPCFEEQLNGRNASVLTVLGRELHPSVLYIFTLTVYKNRRHPTSASQRVTVCEAPVLPVNVNCVSCTVFSSHHYISNSNAIILLGQCHECGDHTQYQWSGADQSGKMLDLYGLPATSTGGLSSNLVLRSDILQPGQSYTFSLNVTHPGRVRWGSASLTILPNNPPHGGLCQLSPESDIHLLETVVTFNCSGWKDDENEASQLIYTFQVKPCQPSNNLCPVLTLYRGPRPTSGSLVPMGSPEQEGHTSVITVIVLVEDNLGAKVIALSKNLTVESHVKENVASQWFRDTSLTELWTLMQRSNPQEIIPYSVALISQLNQIKSGKNKNELKSRREICKKVTQTLASLPISSMFDVDRISSALAFSTAIADELVCDACQEQIIEAVGKMINVIGEQRSPGVLSVFDRGRSILNIIGSSLAAISVRAPTSASNYTSTLQAGALMALSALDHAGALMRSLVHSHVHDTMPFPLFTPHISTVGFHGSPSHLLCTQSLSINGSTGSHPCPFLIPHSLTAHLQSQMSEVVQVLFGIDGPREFHPLLTVANPGISTSLVAMELTTPQGEPIHIQDLDPEEAIRVILPNKYPVGQSEDGGPDDHTNRTWLTVSLPTHGRLNFTVNAVGGLQENAGLYISFNFSLAPGAAPVSFGHVKIDMSSTASELNNSHSLVREWAVRLSALASFTEKTIFLSPLLNGTDKHLSINLTSSLADGGPVRVSICVFSSLCQYYNVKEKRWSSEGLQPLEGSTLHAVHCLTRHLTMFGASLFVHPDAVVLLPPLGGPTRNMLVGIVCAILVVVHLMMGFIAIKLDHLDSLKLSQVPLCGPPGLYHYKVLVKTGLSQGAGTTAHVGISLYGVSKSGSRHLQKDGAFHRGSLDQFHIETDDNLGEVWKIRLWHDNTGLDPSWFVQHVVVWDSQSDHMFFFLVEDWLSVESQKNGTVEKEILASCPEELYQFQRVLLSQLMFGMVEHHMWLSLLERPTHSHFTRGQRITCSALTLHLYLALGALWYGAVGSEGQSGPVSTQMLVNMETAAVGMVIAVLVFPLQCFLCFLFRKSHSQVMMDMSAPPSPLCQSVEMDIYLGQSALSGPSFLSLPCSSSTARDSPSSLLESKAFDSSIMDFWAASGLMAKTDGACDEAGVAVWASSCESLLTDPSTETALPATNLYKASSAFCPTRQLTRKKALMQLHRASPASHATLVPSAPSDPSLGTESQDVCSTSDKMLKVYNHNLTTYLTMSEENLLMSIAAEEDGESHTRNNNSDSGNDSPRTISSFSNNRSTSCGSWSDQTEDKSLHVADIQSSPLSYPSPHETNLYKCPSVLSVDSVASTFLPIPSTNSTRSASPPRIGVARGQPGWLLPSWLLCVIYPVVALLMGACLALAGLYGSFFSRTVVLMWLISALTAFLASALLLEPLKVCVQAVICAALWRPVDPEVDDELARETTVMRSTGKHIGKVWPPCGYGLLQAKEEARKVRALRLLIRQCVCRLLFLLLVLMVNYQDRMEQRQGRLLALAIRCHLEKAPLGGPNLTSIQSWSDAEQWIDASLVSHLHQNPLLHLVGLPRLQYSHSLGPTVDILLGNSSMVTNQLLTGLNMAKWSTKRFKTLSIDFTHYHRESGLFVCVSIRLEWDQKQRVIPSLFVYPMLIPSSILGLDLHIVLTVLLLLCALLILSVELRSMATERAQFLRQGQHWFQLLLASLSLAGSILQLCFLSQLKSQPDVFINFLNPALLAQRSSQCVAVLLTLLVLELLGTLRFVRKWVVICRLLQRAWRELWALTVLLLLMLMLSTHLGIMLFSSSMEGYQSVREAIMSVTSLLRGRAHLQRLCTRHPMLGPVYGLLMMVACFWILVRLFGAIFSRSYRAEQVYMYHPAIEPQEYEMVEFFIKRLKLWIGLTKAKEFRHRVKFEDMDVPPSRSSEESVLSTVSSFPPSSYSPLLSSSLSSPRLLSSSLSVTSGDSSLSEHGFDIQSHVDHLLPCVSALLAKFDCVNQITEEVHGLEVKLEEALNRRRRRKSTKNHQKPAETFKQYAKPKEQEGKRRETEVRCRRIDPPLPDHQNSLPSMSPFTPSKCYSTDMSNFIFPHKRSSHSESEAIHVSCDTCPPEVAKLNSGSFWLHPADSFGLDGNPRRRAWHCGSSHSADAAQRALKEQGGVATWCKREECFSFTITRPRSEDGLRPSISDGVPKKRKAWISEGPETKQTPSVPL